MSALLTRQQRPSIDSTRSVFVNVHVGKLGTETVNPDLSSMDWREWIKCTPQDIEKGTIAGLAAHRAFRNHGGPGLFRFCPAVEVVVHLYDPATHHEKHGRVLDMHRTIYKFTPTA